MSKPTLTAQPALGGYDRTFGSTRLAECTDLAAVSITVPLGGDMEFESALASAYGISRPEPGMSVLARDGETRLLALGVDQFFALFSHATPDALQIVGSALEDAAYLTDQTDNWVFLELTGPRARPALERICPIDLHPTSFSVGSAARTVMEHLGALVVRMDDESYLLASASSSAGSFLHAIETSIENVSP